jgi:hypothetical protein
MSAGSAMDISIISLLFQVTNIPGISTTREYLFEIGVGVSGAEVVQVQIPYSVRMDTAVGYYLTSQSLYLPEPLIVLANKRIAVRCYNNAAAATAQSGVKLFIKGGNEAFYYLSDPMGNSGFFGG